MISDRLEIAAPKALVISGLVLLLILFAAPGLPWRLGYLDLGSINCQRFYCFAMSVRFGRGLQV